MQMIIDLDVPPQGVCVFLLSYGNGGSSAQLNAECVKYDERPLITPTGSSSTVAKECKKQNSCGKRAKELPKRIKPTLSEWIRMGQGYSTRQLRDKVTSFITRSKRWYRHFFLCCCAVRCTISSSTRYYNGQDK